MDTLLIISATTASLYALDLFSSAIYLAHKPKEKSVPHNARWFFVHAVTNVFVLSSCAHDLYLCATQPANSLTLASPGTYTALISALTLHIYHVIFFYNHLTDSDILHHGVMCGISGPLALMHTSRLTGAGLWFLTGLPGAIDYTLLWLVKMGALDKMREKEAYVLISTWLRSPGCLLCCFCSARALSNCSSPLLQLYTVANAILLAWNGQYYLMITSRDYGKTLEKLKNKREMRDT